MLIMFSGHSAVMTTSDFSDILISVADKEGEVMDPTKTARPCIATSYDGLVVGRSATD
jgi:hypothetical protein